MIVTKASSLATYTKIGLLGQVHSCGGYVSVDWKVHYAAKQRVWDRVFRSVRHHQLNRPMGEGTSAAVQDSIEVRSKTNGGETDGDDDEKARSHGNVYPSR